MVGLGVATCLHASGRDPLQKPKLGHGGKGVVQEQSAQESLRLRGARAVDPLHQVGRQLCWHRVGSLREMVRGKQHFSSDAIFSMKQEVKSSAEPLDGRSRVCAI